MAVGRQLNIKGQMRIDVPHLRLIESGVAYDFDVLAGATLSGKKPYIIKGFEISSWTPGAAASSLQVVTAGSVVFNYGASANGTMLMIPDDRAPETLTVANSRVSGSFTASQTNYVGLDFTRTEDSTTLDIVQFLDATTLSVTPKEVPLARTLDYRIVISTTPFQAYLCPIAIVVTNASNNIVSVTDARTMYFRLAEGGISPNPLGVYSWPQGRAPEVSTTFVGGDKAITNEKDWKSAVMHRIWEVTGGEYWYSNTTDRNLKFYAISTSSHTRAAQTRNIIWDGTDVTWSGLAILLSNSTASRNSINDQTTTSPGLTNLADGECIYVDVNRYTQDAALTAVKGVTADLEATPPTRVGSRYILIWRNGANVFNRLSEYENGFALDVPIATNTTYGIVKTHVAAAGPAGGPFAVILNSGSGIDVTSLLATPAGVFTNAATGTPLDVVGNTTRGGIHFTPVDAADAVAANNDLFVNNAQKSLVLRQPTYGGFNYISGLWVLAEADSSAQAFGAAGVLSTVGNIVRFQTELEDPWGAFSQPTSIFTAPEGGLYHVASTIWVESSVANDVLALQIVKNATTIQFAEYNQINNVDPVPVNVSGIVRLAAGDTITINAAPVAAVANIDTAVLLAKKSLAICRIS